MGRYLSLVNWENVRAERADVLVIGSGLAGMYTALEASKKGRVILACKGQLRDSNTRYAQGGVAAVMTPQDSLDVHLEDTLRAGAGLNDIRAVDRLVREAPAAVAALLSLGVNFDRKNGKLSVTKEGAHRHRRVLHAGGDATGFEIVRALADEVERTPTIQVLPLTYAVDLLTDTDGACIGAGFLDASDKPLCVLARMTVLATGGAGQLYAYTTNPDIATADGVGLAYRAGARIADLEFTQFHPTVFFHGQAPSFLVSEAVRGEGAVLRNRHGDRFMSRYHPDAELAPRDVVARAVLEEAMRCDDDVAYLDITDQSRDELERRFPTIFGFLLAQGFDMSKDLIPVAPAAHYMMGGVRTSLNGETSVPRLYAVGEAACNGLHGANRLASNSLSEAVVFGAHVARELDRWDLDAKPQRSVYNSGKGNFCTWSPDVSARSQLQRIMTEHVGVRRQRDGLLTALRKLGEWQLVMDTAQTSKAGFEFVNLLTAARIAAEAALLREESRGAHSRIDFPSQDDAHYRAHLVFARDTGVIKEDVEA